MSDPGQDQAVRNHSHSSRHPDWLDQGKMAKGELGVVHKHGGLPEHLHKRPGSSARYSFGTDQAIDIQVHNDPPAPQVIPVVVACPRCGYRP